MGEVLGEREVAGVAGEGTDDDALGGVVEPLGGDEDTGLERYCSMR